MSEFTFMGPTLEWSSSKGPVFQLKKKDPEGGCPYYIFNIIEENFMGDKDKDKFYFVFNNIILPKAREMGLAMFSFTEITESIRVPPEEGDMILTLFNYSSQQEEFLSIGVRNDE